MLYIHEVDKYGPDHRSRFTLGPFPIYASFCMNVNLSSASHLSLESMFPQTLLVAQHCVEESSI